MPSRSQQAERLAKVVDYLIMGATNIERQRVLIRELALDGHDTTEAYKSLERLEELQAIYSHDKDRLIAWLASVHP